MSNITISVGTELHIALGEPATYDVAGYSALTYTEVGEVGTVPEFGGTAQVAEFIPIKTGVVDKRRGSINYGSSQINLARDVTDAGQAALHSGFDGANAGEIHSVKLIHPDQGVIYFTAIITSFTFNLNDANSITQGSVALELLSKPVADADVYTVTFVAGANGSIIGETTQLVVSGGDCTPVYAAADGGFAFDEWNGGNTTNPRTITNVTANATYTASFV